MQTQQWQTTINGEIALHDWHEFMYTQPSTTPTVTHFLDADYMIVIAEHIVRYSLAIPIVVEPGLMGQYDFETGRDCDPVGRGYKTLTDIEAYIIAYRDTDAMANNLEYQDDMLDREDWSRGAW